jgi:glycosyltransferase involved in cell wall biosynthesis
MRVLHISAGNLYGGVETLLVTLSRCRHLCPEMEPEFAVCFEERLSQELALEGVRIHMLGNVRVRQPISVWRARRRLEKLLIERDFDAAVCHMVWPQAIFGPVIRSAGIPLVFWLHSATTGRHWLEQWARHTPPDLALCNSDFTKGSLKQVYPDSPAETIYCPVARSGSQGNETRAMVRAELNVVADNVIITQVSRLEEWKGQGLLLEALGRLRSIPNWSCWIVGGAQRSDENLYFGKLKAKTDKLAISDRIHFLGQRSDVERLLSATDIFCQPNTGPEPFGIVFIEALYAGIPVVTTAIGGAMEIVERSTGILVTPNNPDDLAAALRELISNSGLREKLGACGPARAAELCDPSRQIQRLDSILRQVARFDEPRSVVRQTFG